ncbi:protein RfbU [Geobacter sp. OR-1]|uniref:glycosyltransferase family 4 protein n=1 Tax=Geobacter sp. OR-1 TaxID=1266765 RepID=UPI000543B2C9|nr:glycosyltransferase family 1 protein [Geobacter sp. OR-1]GAM08238.1 protein RfbU [Geobacter sp. OR-1]
MRIGVDAKCFIGNMTGVGNYCFNLLKELVTIRPDDEFYLFAHKDFALDLKHCNKFVSKGPISKSGIIWLMAQGPGLLKKYDIDVFWATTSLLPPNLNGIGTVLTLYDFVWRRYPSTMPFLFRTALALFSKRSIEKADRIVSISNSTAAEVHAYYGRIPDTIIKPGVSPMYAKRSDQEVSAVKAKYNISTNYNLIVGTLEPRKNLDAFLRAYSDLAESSDVDVPSLVIVGGKGWSNGNLLTRLQRLEQRGLVHRLGYVPEEDLPALYSGATLFFMPSLYEGFGMPVLEAYSCSTPVVVSDIPALHEACCEHALFHGTSYEGIYDMLELIFRGKIVPQQPVTSLVDWNWQSGAKMLSIAIDEAAAAR